MTYDAAEFIAPIGLAVVIGAILIFGPRRGRMLPDEKQRVFRFVRRLVSIAVTGVAWIAAERWLGARFGISAWASFGVLAGIAIAVGFLIEGIRSRFGERPEPSS